MEEFESIQKGLLFWIVYESMCCLNSNHGNKFDKYYTFN